MHNLAMALHLKGYEVSGSDDEIFEPARGRLARYGLLPSEEGWHPERVSPDLDAVILGMHARKDNPELLRAKELGLKIYSYPEYLYEHSEYALGLFRKYLTEQDIEYLATEHLFIDGKVTVEINLDNCSVPVFFLGESNCAVRVRDYGVAKIYAFNKSRLNITCTDRAIANVESFGNSDIYAHNDGTSKCTVYSYDNSSVSGNAHIIRKEYRRGEVFNGKEMER